MAFRGRRQGTPIRLTPLDPRLMRTYVSQVEALRRLRQGGSQFVRVEHVHVHEGAQAVIGNVTPGNKKHGGDESS